MSYTVLIPDSVDQKAVDLIEAADGLDVVYPGKLTQDELVAQVGDAHALIIRSGVKITPEVFAAAPNLKVVARAGVGVDNVDLDAATEHGVVVVNTPGGNTISTAEHTFGLMIALARHIPQGDASLRAGRWDRKLFTGVELKGKTLGLVGLGRIGQAIAKRAQAFEMNVVAHDPYIPAEVASDMGVVLLDLDGVFAHADFISLHAPIMDETRGMINADSIAKMKDGVRIINAARGGLINDADLAAAIKSGKVAGAALDVYEPEPPAADNPLIGLDGVIHTPHLAASTSDAQVTVAIEAAQLVIDALLHNKPQNVVNKAVLES
ncbi:MAG: hypothetical protein KC546_16505 [Anaerolineae bacterium]|nr:hypothetical protein [Anaerolineae bacterium]MCA9894458.1 hypothetical protein [Anaerolineae bacterium]